QENSIGARVNAVVCLGFYYLCYTSNRIENTIDFILTNEISGHFGEDRAFAGEPISGTFIRTEECRKNIVHLGSHSHFLRAAAFWFCRAICPARNGVDISSIRDICHGLTTEMMPQVIRKLARPFRVDET